MCYKVNCNICQKSTWKGCGLHIDSALKGVALEDRCNGWKNGRCTQKKGEIIKTTTTDSIDQKECINDITNEQATVTNTSDNCQLN